MEQFQYPPYAPIIFVSALTKQRLHKLPEMIKHQESQNTRIPSAVLNDVIMDAIATSTHHRQTKENVFKDFHATHGNQTTNLCHLCQWRRTHALLPAFLKIKSARPLFWGNTDSSHRKKTQQKRIWNDSSDFLI